MNSLLGQSRSVWMPSPLPSPPPLVSELEAEVCVVGAGIAGLSTAYLLGRAGKSVVVLDDGPVGGGQTARTTAHLAYAIAVAMAPPVLPALFWDTLDPYHYARFQQDRPGGEALLLVGGEDHRTGQEDDADGRYARLEAWARERFPGLAEVRARWSGQVLETFDGLGFIGRNPLDEANVFIATGDSGMGMTHGTLAGMLLTDLILGLPNPWVDLYDPARKTLRALPRFVADTANQAWQYKSWLTPGDLESVEGLPRCHGGILRRGRKKVAVYRDEMGEVHELSAVCPHLGGIVAWNAAEATWDCPCHGSRFDRYGKVINGPAISDLSQEG